LLYGVTVNSSLQQIFIKENSENRIMCGNEIYRYLLYSGDNRWQCSVHFFYFLVSRKGKGNALYVIKFN